MLLSPGPDAGREGAPGGVRRGLTAFARGNAILRLPLRAGRSVLTKSQRAYWLARRRGEIDAYLGAHSPKKLNIGSGSNPLRGWLNTDLFPRGRPRPILLDAARPLPLPDQSFDYIFTEHMIEHVAFERGIALLGECCRVLKPGGTLRVATPDLRVLAGLCRDDKTDLQRRYVRWSVDNFTPDAGMYEESLVVNNFFRNWGHKFIYDEATLRAAL
ncbi:MAG: methyltransferase domain-containing protein, partial [Pyrinomonadaceae bacterium]